MSCLRPNIDAMQPHIPRLSLFRRGGKPPRPAFAATASLQKQYLIIFLILVGVAVWGSWMHHLHVRNQALQQEVRFLETKWTNVSQALQEAESIQPHFELAVDEARRLLEQNTRRGWTGALRSVLQSGRAEIELQDIRVTRTSDDFQACKMMLQGVGAGATPRLAADAFRAELQKKMESEFPGRVEATFENLEDRLSTSEGTAKADFSISVSIGPSDPRQSTGIPGA